MNCNGIGSSSRWIPLRCDTQTWRVNYFTLPRLRSKRRRFQHYSCSYPSVLSHEYWQQQGGTQLNFRFCLIIYSYPAVWESIHLGSHRIFYKHQIHWVKRWQYQLVDKCHHAWYRCALFFWTSESMVWGCTGALCVSVWYGLQLTLCHSVDPAQTYHLHN